MSNAVRFALRWEFRGCFASGPVPILEAEKEAPGLEDIEHVVSSETNQLTLLHG